MRFDHLMMGAVIGAFLYLSGYRGIAFAVWIISVFLLFSDVKLGAPSKAKPKGYEMGDPIIIESTRKPPFRIPEEIKLAAKADGKTETMAKGKWVDAQESYTHWVEHLGKRIRDWL